MLLAIAHGVDLGACVKSHASQPIPVLLAGLADLVDDPELASREILRQRAPDEPLNGFGVHAVLAQRLDRTPGGCKEAHRPALLAGNRLKGFEGSGLARAGARFEHGNRALSSQGLIEGEQLLIGEVFEGLAVRVGGLLFAVPAAQRLEVSRRRWRDRLRPGEQLRNEDEIVGFSGAGRLGGQVVLRVRQKSVESLGYGGVDRARRGSDRLILAQERHPQESNQGCLLELGAREDRVALCKPSDREGDALGGDGGQRTAFLRASARGALCGR
jgi:hypothetical protein